MFFCLYILTFKQKYILSRSKPTTNFVKYLKYIQDSYIQDWVLDMINKLKGYFKRYKLGKAEVGAKGPPVPLLTRALEGPHNFPGYPTLIKNCNFSQSRKAKQWKEIRQFFEQN